MNTEKPSPSAVPRRYRNIINPWLTKREVAASVKFVDGMLVEYQPDERKRLTREDCEDRQW